MNVTLKQVRSFVAVAQFGSFTRAAAAVNISQPALTVQIKQMEKELRVRLLDRTTRAVNLTPVGKQLAPALQRAVNEFDAIFDHVRQVSPRYTETLTVACIPSLAGSVVPEVISDLVREYPRTDVLLKDVGWKKVLSLVRAGEVDFGIGASKYTEDGLEVVRLINDPLHVVFPAKHPLQRMRKVTLQSIAEYPLIITGRESSVRSTIDDHFARHGLFVTPICEVAQFSSAVGMVRAGFGITILPTTAIELRSERLLRSRPIVDTTRKVILLRPSGRPQSPASQRLVAMLVSHFRQLQKRSRSPRKGSSRRPADNRRTRGRSAS